MGDDAVPRERLLGYYALPSAIAVIDAPFRARGVLDAAVALPPAELQAELTRRHEFAHYRQAMSTPYGMLLWRSFAALISNVEHVAEGVSRIGPLPAAPALHDWVRAQTDGRLDRVRHSCDQVDVLLDFIAALLDRPEGLTVGGFIQTCTQAFAEICERADLACTVTFGSRRRLDAPLFAHGSWSGAELLEAAARLEERLLLEDLAHSTGHPADIAAWEDSAIFGVYEPAYRWLMAETGDARVALALIDTAFMTPFDPAFLQHGAISLCIEDLLPALRLPRLVAEASRNFWPDDAGELDAWLGRGLCEAVGLEAPQEIAARGITAAYNGPNAWGRDFAQRGGPAAIDPARIFAYFDSESRRAMQLRHASPSALLREPYAADIAFRPAVIFYSDHVFFGIHGLQAREEEGFWLAAALFRKFLYDERLLALIGLRAECDSRPLCEKLWRRLTQPFSPDGPDGPEDRLQAFVSGLRAAGTSDDLLKDLFFGRRLPVFGPG